MNAHEANRKRTILLVEDEASTRQFLRAVLTGSDFSVLESSNGMEALRLMESHRPEIDLLLADVIMPQMGGRELAARLRISNPNLKVLFISGYEHSLIGRLDTGTDFLQKPFTVDKLRLKIEKLLG
ncbi:MAG: response regulator [Bryobacteraceae bacterium]|nr:response regulator [Bryobacterales bacterium]MEB2364313.1 response regulator [Bryobacterales bacterium]NUN03845.1 response regulator [Bryobacteraceae bacterium]